MIGSYVKAHFGRLTAAYAVSMAGSVAGQLYPFATALAINGVLERRYAAIGWLVACHFGALILEVSAKMLDTRVFARIYADIATSFVRRAHDEGQDPSLIAARAALSREYVTFLERDVPAVLFAVIGLSVSVSALFWLDTYIGLACLALILPLLAINRWLAGRSLALNRGLNDRLEREIDVLRRGRASTVERHFRALGGWRIRLSDAEASAYGAMEISVILLFVVALARLADNDATRAGDIYAIFAYLWKFIVALDQVPQLVQQMAKLRDLNGRLVQRGERSENELT
ncbi:MAG TPA: ABC transporter six-transmembrane domain-containing protein [Tahibacter sp.]|uniref:ABC transporter six-transmembrane domain-containing protein n=1 Tax=Tahibacter sp. TaxID=2056211 RepID=UPI002BCEA833|nr:ABC transporter six-transmembrane domain-containing protein [Tahibacter sp.]HSX62373.1 ABC transporter six-transmembrane domain-containing protein [Tahibacter sp.]